MDFERGLEIQKAVNESIQEAKTRLNTESLGEYSDFGGS